MKYLFTFTVVVVLGVVAAYPLWQASSPWQTAASIKPVFDTAEVTRGTIRKIVSTSGPVRALVTVSVGSQLSGQIDKVFVDFNSEVKAGAPLATLDTRTFAARVAQAKADLAAARASLANQKALLVKSEAVLRLAERNNTRQKTLETRGFASRSTLDTADRDAEVARADITIAGAMIANAEAVIAQRQAALDQAQIDLDRTHINSPIDGTVISRSVDPGQTVAASLQSPELFKIAQDLQRIRIEAQVNEADVGAIAEGNPATFTVDAYPEQQFEGRVSQVRLAATELNTIVTYTVIIEAANEGRRLFPGMTANVQIEAAARADVLRIPNEALRFRPRGELAAQTEGQPKAERGDRSARQIERLKAELELSDAQEAALRTGIGEMMAGMRRTQTGTESAVSDPGQMRIRIAAKIEQILSPLLSEAQRPLFEKWKAGREGTRVGTVWVITPSGAIEKRVMRLAITDGEFTEVAKGPLSEGEKVVLRAKSPAT